MSLILAAPTTNKRAAEPGIIALLPREEPNEKLSSRNVDAVPGCPFNCNEDGCDLCAPPSPSIESENQRDELLKRNEVDLIPEEEKKDVKRHICTSPPRDCEGPSCIHGCNPPEEEEAPQIEEVAKDVKRHICTSPPRDCEGPSCIHGCNPPEEDEAPEIEEVPQIEEVTKDVKRHICTSPPRDCEGPSCIHGCHPPEEEEAPEIEEEKVKREDDHLCTSPPDCEGIDCIHCPSEEETEKEKRAAKFCSPSCIGEKCHCEDEEEQPVKRAEKVCIPHCVGEHCSCEDGE